jgi:hypothetical protein
MRRVARAIFPNYSKQVSLETSLLEYRSSNIFLSTFKNHAHSSSALTDNSLGEVGAPIAKNYEPRAEWNRFENEYLNEPDRPLFYRILEKHASEKREPKDFMPLAERIIKREQSIFNTDLKVYATTMTKLHNYLSKNDLSKYVVDQKHKSYIEYEALYKWAEYESYKYTYGEERVSGAEYIQSEVPFFAFKAVIENLKPNLVKEGMKLADDTINFVEHETDIILGKRVLKWEKFIERQKKEKNSSQQQADKEPAYTR